MSPEVRGSRAELDDLIAEEFVEIGSSGQVWHKPDIIEALCEESDVTFEMGEFGVRLLGEDLVLARYRVKKRQKGEGVEQSSQRSSIWRLRCGRWQIIFHQSTPEVSI